MPSLTPDALAQKDSLYRSRLLGWIQEASVEGDSINQADPNYDKIQTGMRYVLGDQQPSPDQPTFPRYLQPMTFNFSRKACMAHVSALTDVKPTFGWKSLNPKYQMHAHQLNLLAIAWWLETMADLVFGDVIKTAWACGTADMAVEWNAGMGEGGNHCVIPKDPRDTLPWRPTRYGDEQQWQGVIFRELWTVNALREKYHDFAPYIQATEDSLLSTVKGLFFRKATNFQTPMDPLSTIGGAARQAGPPRVGDTVLYKTFLNDRTRNMSGRPLTVGSHNSLQYVVQPQGLLFPYKRLIVTNNDLVLYDGPNPYMHGKYPFARLHLWKLPWCFLGQPALADTVPIQDAINAAAMHMKMGIEQWMDQQVVLNKDAVSGATAKAYDSRKPGFTFKMKMNAVDPDKVVRKIDGPNPQVIATNFEWYKELKADHESLTGVAQLQQLMQLRQLPGADTVQKYFEAMTPELRMEGRMFEAFLRKVSQQIGPNTFQFMTSARRVAILGDAGALLSDFDFEPDSLVPALKPTMMGSDPGTGLPGMVPNPDYDPTFDADRPRGERAQALAKLMVFVVAPNSVLAFNAQEEKMLRFQMSRMGYYDVWSLAETLEIPNFGAPPPIPLPPLQPPPPEAMQNPQLLLAWLQSQPVGKYILDPATGSLLEVRQPITVTERLQAQQMLQIGMTENPAGRKASGGAPPKSETKSDGDGGERTTITESKK
jgi:hypothetical protein